MANIYTHEKITLGDLLNRAGHDATILIPNLQRPYIWDPSQVTLLVDSLIRGWPFGTLLTWRISQDQEARLPDRPLWLMVNRVPGSAGTQVSEAHAPADFQMILDGQQRVQSLLLAFGSDEAGFKLPDEDWHKALNGITKKGRKNNVVHWSKGSLCLDLDKFGELYENSGAGVRVADLDFTKCLEWIITDTQDGRNLEGKPPNYSAPIKERNAGGKRHLRLWRLWHLVGNDPNNTSFQFMDDFKKKVDEWELGQVDETTVRGVAELMTVFKGIKESSVTYLELMPYRKESHTLEGYNDAVVNIFTRLNTAGRTLTTQQITYAWLKTSWNDEATQGEDAESCIEALSEALRSYDVDVESESLIEVLSFMWSSLFRDGKLLSQSDHLKGEIVTPMAKDLSTHWDSIKSSVLDAAQVLQERNLIHGHLYHSLIPLAVPACQLFILSALKKRISGAMNESQRQSFDDNAKKGFLRASSRWIFCPQWAGSWSVSGSYKADCAKELWEAKEGLEGVGSYPVEDQDFFDGFFSNFLSEKVVIKAVENIQELQVYQRTRVRAYYQYLWVWHRLSDKRLECSKVVLREGKRKVSLEVDHVTPASRWDSAEHRDGITVEERAKLQASGNSIGNCLLLEKNFNISKSSRSLDAFVNAAPDSFFQEMTREEFLSGLEIPSTLSGESGEVETLVGDIETRSALIKKELIQFAEGELRRAD